MKYIAGLILGLVLGGVGTLYAKDIVQTTSFYQVKSVSVEDTVNTIQKFYDEDNGVSCYTYTRWGRGAGSISCVK